MPYGYNIDLRTRVAHYLRQGHGAKEASEVFQLSLANVYRWKSQYEETKDLRIKQRSGKPRALLPDAQVK
jgi:transposase